MKLTPKQKAFADYYIETLHLTDSYQRAYGSSYNVARKNASRLMANEGICAYIKERMLEKDNERILSQDAVLEFLSDVVKGKITEQVPLVLGKDFKVIDKEPSIRDRIKAAEWIGKRYALFTEKHDISGDIGLHINVDYGDDLEDD